MSYRRAVIQLIITALCWAAMFHLGKWVLQQLPVLELTTWRMLLAALTLGIWVWLSEGYNWQAIRKNVRPLLMMVLLGVVGFNLALYGGLEGSSPVNASLLMATTPALTAVMSALLLRERLNVQQWLGAGLAFAGVVTVVSRGSWQMLQHLNLSPADGLIMLAVLGWVSYGVIGRGFVRGMTTLQMTTVTLIAGALGLMGISVPAQGLHLPTLPLFAALVVMGVLGVGLTYVWWNQGIKALGTARATIFINLVPVLTCLMGLLLGQVVTGAQWLGMLLVISGVLLSSRPAPAPAPAGKPALAR